MQGPSAPELWPSEDERCTLMVSPQGRNSSGWFSCPRVAGAQGRFPDLASECQCWVHNCAVFDDKRQEWAPLVLWSASLANTDCKCFNDFCEMFSQSQISLSPWAEQGLLTVVPEPPEMKRCCSLFWNSLVRWRNESVPTFHQRQRSKGPGAGDQYCGPEYLLGCVLATPVIVWDEWEGRVISSSVWVFQQGW